MARRSLIARKPKKEKVKVSRSGQHLLDLKHVGGEPSFKGDTPTDTELTRAFNWYNYMKDAGDAKSYLKVFFSEELDVVRALGSIEDVWISRTAGWIARLLSRGYDLPQNCFDYLAKEIEGIKRKAEQATQPPEVKAGPVRDKTKERLSDFLGTIDEMVDAGRFRTSSDSPLEWFKSQNVPAAFMVRVVAKYVPILQEILDAHGGEDDELVEAYGEYTIGELESYIGLYNRIIESAESYMSGPTRVMKPRKPRKTKPIPPEKKLKFLKPQMSNEEFGISSIKLDKILGAQELWVFNTKYRLLTVFRASDKSGLDVNRTSVINFDKSKSMTRRTGRRSQDYVNRVLSSGRVPLRTLMDELKGDVSLQERISENVVVLRAVQ
jgi:hypothetical protein